MPSQRDVPYSSVIFSIEPRFIQSAPRLREAPQMVGPLGPGPSRPQIAMIFYPISLKHVRRLNCLSLLNAEKCSHSKTALSFSQTGLMTGAQTRSNLPRIPLGTRAGGRRRAAGGECGECVGLARLAAS